MALLRPICLAKNRRLLLPRLVKLRSVNFPSEKDQSSLDTKSVFRVRGVERMIVAAMIVCALLAAALYGVNETFESLS